MNFQHAKQIFADFISSFDTADDKIRLKIIHTFGVVSASEYLGEALDLPDTDRELAKHIALLHDLGRFRQLALYHSFDDSIVAHAVLSLKILFEEHMIERFLPERDFDSIIYTAIQNHGLYQMTPGLTGPALLQSQIIRDADKLDNFRVKAESDMISMVDVDEQELGREAISPHIFRAYMEGRPVLNSDRITHMDMWVSYLGYLYDLNFPESLRYIEEHDYVNRLVDRIPYENEATHEEMQRIRQKALDYIQTHTSV